MMQANEVVQRFERIEQAIAEAAQCCIREQTMPMDLKNAIDQLDQQKSSVRQAIAGGDKARIVQAVDQLESLADRAKAACRAGNLSEETRSTVLQVHDMLSELKHRLH